MYGSNQAPVKPGDLLAGKYRVDKVIGVGGMGVVVAATHEALDQKVALKFLHAELAEHPEAAARFQREARAAVKIRSDHVCKVSDVGTLDNGAPYMVMEFLHGHDLAEHLLTHTVSVEDAIDWVLQACEAIAEAHAAGIVHRDLKPANLFLAERADGSQRVKVLDFGISKLTDGEVSLTRTSSVMGSPQYMAPEQMVSSKRVDGRTDIWALGTILYEVLTGEPAFKGETVPEIAIAIVNTEPEPLAAKRPDLHPELVATVERCLKKSPEDRFQHVGELAAALAPHGSPMSRFAADRASRVLYTHTLGTPVTAGEVAPTSLQLATHSPKPSSSQYDVSPTVASNSGLMPAPAAPSSRKSFVFGAVGGGVLLLVAAVAFSLGGGGAPANEPSAPAASPQSTAETQPEVVPASQPVPSAEPQPSQPAAQAAPASASAAAASPPTAPAAPARPGSRGPEPKPKELGLDSFGDRK